MQDHAHHCRQQNDHPEKIDLVKAELLEQIDVTCAKVGGITYDQREDNENPAHFVFHKTRETRDLWQTHMGSQHLKDVMTGIG